MIYSERNLINKSILYNGARQRKGDRIVSKWIISGGSSTENSVSFFLEDMDNGIKATRLENGKIITEEVSSVEMIKGIAKVLKVIFGYSLFREFVFIFKLPIWLYHLPTIYFSLALILGIIKLLTQKETRMYHGAEHKVANFFRKGDTKVDFRNIEKSSRIHTNCGTNLLATIVTFQLVSSVSMSCFNIHIPEIITAILPFCVYTIFPFNLLGLLTQFLTTANPKEQHIVVALEALYALVKKY